MYFETALNVLKGERKLFGTKVYYLYTSIFICRICEIDKSGCRRRKKREEIKKQEKKNGEKTKYTNEMFFGLGELDNEDILRE